MTLFQILLERTSREAEGHTLRRAALAALAIHIVLLWLPLPRSRPATVASPSEDEPALIDFKDVIPPPPLPPPPRPRRPRAETRPIPVPDRTSVEELIERLPAPTPIDEGDLQIEGLVEGAEPWIDPDALGPPAPAGPVDEWAVGLERPLRLEGAAQPVYPELSRKIRQQGTVYLRAVIETDGRVVDVEVISAPRPETGLAGSAVEAVRNWRYRPGTINGRPVAVEMTVLVIFTLR